MAGRILVTRAEPGAGETATRLVEMGFDPLVEPMLELAAVSPVPDLKVDQAGGLVFTSANGVRFFAEVSAQRDLTAWCVGPATETAAREAGFTDIRNADGDADALFDLLAGEVAPGAAPLLHIANTAAAGDLVARLNAAGIAAEFVGLYDARPCTALSDAAEAALRSREVAAILIHSAKGAEALNACLGRFETASIHLVAVSAKAAAPLSHRVWKRTAIAAVPNETALLDAIHNALTAP